MSGQPITYQQLLAEQYEENARDLLVYQQTDYENVGESDVQEHNARDDIGYEVPDQQEFQRFAGTRSDENIVLKTKEFDDKGVSSVRRAKDVKTNIFNIDSLFRAYAVGGIPPTDPTLVANESVYYKQLAKYDYTTASPSHFIFNLDSPYKNIISAKLSSFQLPNKFYNLVDIRNNYYIYIKDSAYDDYTAVYISNITYDPKKNITTVNFCNPVNPLNVGETITFVGTANYDNTDFTVLNSTPTSIEIDNLQNPVTETFPCNSQTTYAYINVPPGSLTGYAQVPVYITSVNKNPKIRPIPDITKPYLGVYEDTLGQTGFYYSNTSIFPALNTSFSNVNFYPDISFSLVDGYCVISNSSTQHTYTLNFTPETTGLQPAYFKTLGAMLGFNDYIYEISPKSSNPLPGCNIDYAQISCYNQAGSLASENKVNMNADDYILLAIGDWQNIYHQDGADSYYSVFAKIPVNVQKGDVIYDIVYNNSIDKKYSFIQPENIRYLEIQLYDRLGRNLIMPGVDWSMVIEAEEVLNASLYDKLREI